MKKFILGLGIIVGGLTNSMAYANDGWGNCCPPCCEYSGFDGFYFGGNLGVISQLAFRNEDQHGTPFGRTFIDTDFTIGAQLGYDWGCGSSLFGVVVDWDWSNLDQSHNLVTNDDDIKNELDWYLTIRGRAGLTICDCLIYLTAGAAVAHFDTKWNPGSTSFHQEEARWGWTGGVGVEYLLGCKWSLGADLLVMHFDTNRKTFLNPSTSTTYALGSSDSVWVGRVILNYRFGDLFSCFCR